MNSKWIVLVCLVVFVIYAESRREEKKKPKEKGGGENVKPKEEAKAAKTEDKPSEGKPKDTKKSKKHKREARFEESPSLAAGIENIELLPPDEVVENIKVDEAILEDRKPLNKSSKKSKEYVKVKKVDHKPEKKIPIEGECPNSKPKQHVQGKECWNENADNISYAEEGETVPVESVV